MLATIGSIGVAAILACVPAVVLGVTVAWLTKTKGPMAGQGTALAFIVVAVASHPIFTAAIVWWGL